MNVKPLLTLPILAATGFLLLDSSAFSQTTATVEQTTTTKGTASLAKGDPVGISARDGISMSGADVLITRNGVSEVLKQPLDLPNNIRVFPDGTAMMPDAGKITLRSEQILTLDGRLLDLVPTPRTAPLTTTTVIPAPAAATTTSTNPASSVTVQSSTTTASPAVSPEAQRAGQAAAEAEAARRASGAK